MKTGLIPGIATAAAALALAVFVAAPSAMASPSAFSPSEIERTIVEYYGLGDGSGKEAATLSEADLRSLTEGLAETIGALDPTAFNDVIGHMIADYLGNPGHRKAIATLLPGVRTAIQSELDNGDRQPMTLAILDEAVLAWGTAYSLGFGKGLWLSRGSGLRNLPGFQSKLRAITEAMQLSWQQRGMVLAAGTAMGAAKFAYEYLEQRKLDPSALLSQAEISVVNRLEEKSGSDLLRLKTLAARANSLTASERDDLKNVENRLDSVKGQLPGLYESAPELRGQLRVVSRNLEMEKTLISSIR